MNIQVFNSSSAGNCTLVDSPSPLLLDCGLPFREIQRHMKFQTSRLAGCLISHAHADHSKAAKDLMKAGVDIFTGQETIGALGLSGHRANAVAAKEQFAVGEWQVMPFDLEHDIPNLGFLLSNGRDKLVYITDTSYSKFTFTGLTHILLETNYSMPILRANVASGAVPVEMKSRIIRSHMSIETALEMIRTNDNSRLQELHLIHLSDGNSNAEEFKRRAQEVTGKPVYISNK